MTEESARALVREWRARRQTALHKVRSLEDRGSKRLYTMLADAWGQAAEELETLIKETR